MFGNDLYGLSNRKSCLINLIAFFNKVAGPVENRRAVNVIDLTLSTLSAVFSNNLKSKLRRFCTRWVDSKMSVKLKSRDLYFNRGLILNDVLKGLILRSELSEMVSDDVDSEVEHTFLKCAEKNKLEGMVNMLEDRADYERGTDRLEKSL